MSNLKSFIYFAVLLTCVSFSDASSLKSDDSSTLQKTEYAAACHPLPNDLSDHYIIGYGSLMESGSKNSTNNNTGVSIPVQVSGFQREWSSKGLTYGPDATYLGVIPYPEADFNAVVFKLPNSTSLISYDNREYYYCRVQVSSANIKFFVEPEKDKPYTRQKQYWIYVNIPQFTAYPTKEFPIVQSYVDIFITGCFQLEKKYSLTDFAKNCVNTTKGWSTMNWVNDRIYPRRPFIYQRQSFKIDKLLYDTIPNYEEIQIEG